MKTGKPYLDGLIDRLLMPLPSMTEREVQELMRDAAQAIHRLAYESAVSDERERCAKLVEESVLVHLGSAAVTK